VVPGQDKKLIGHGATVCIDNPHTCPSAVWPAGTLDAIGEQILEGSLLLLCIADSLR